MLNVRISPHDHDSISTDKAMLYVVFALLPAAIWGCVMFGFRAAVVLVVSIASSLLTEWLLGKINKENTLRDYSALVTGLLIGMNMPPSIPFLIPVLASVFAIFIVKWTFGGLGCNWANPALAGRIFVFFSFSSLMSKFSLPWPLKRGAELVSSATPLSAVKMEITSGLGSEAILSSANVPVSGIASSLSASLGINPYFVDEFLGFAGGCIGEVSALLLIIGGLSYIRGWDHMENSCLLFGFLCTSPVDIWRCQGRKRTLWWRSPSSSCIRRPYAWSLLHGYRLGHYTYNCKGRDNLRFGLWFLHFHHQMLRFLG